MAVVWNWFMTLMIGYFLVSFLNQITRNYLHEQSTINNNNNNKRNK